MRRRPAGRPASGSRPPPRRARRARRRRRARLRGSATTGPGRSRPGASSGPTARRRPCRRRASRYGDPRRRRVTVPSTGRSTRAAQRARVDCRDIMLTTSPPSLLERLRGSWRIVLKEIAAFGVVGAAALVIDIGLFNLLLHQHIGVLTSKGISTGAATAFAYFGNRHWSFSHRARTGLGRETSFFFGINLLAL